MLMLHGVEGLEKNIFNKNDQKQLQQLSCEKMESERGSETLRLGYFPIRAKAQVGRLLCEYLGIPYLDQFFTPGEWESYQRNEAREWIVKGLPFLKDGQFVVTGQHGIIEYIIRRAGANHLLGSSLQDKLKLASLLSKHEVRDSIIALRCQQRKREISREEQTSRLLPKLLELQNRCSLGEWFLADLSVADFYLYELALNLRFFFPDLLSLVPRILSVYERLSSFESIRKYEESQRAVRELDPSRYFRKLSEEGAEALSTSHRH